MNMTLLSHGEKVWNNKPLTMKRPRQTETSRMEDGKIKKSTPKV